MKNKELYLKNDTQKGLIFEIVITFYQVLPMVSTQFQNSTQYQNSTQFQTFDFSSGVISDWLIELSELETTLAGDQLYRAIKHLNKNPLKPEQLYPILEKITPTALHLSDKLEILFAEENIDLTPKIRKRAKLSIQLLRQLSLAYSLLTTSTQFDQFNEKQQALIICRVLQIIGLTLKQSALIYERPSATLWKIMGELYQQAEFNDLLQKEIKDKTISLQQQISISTVLKRNLLFAIINPYQFSVNEICLLFSFADQHCHLLHFYTLNGTSTAYFYWDYCSDLAPQLVNSDYLPKLHLLLETQTLSEYINSNRFDSPFTKETTRQISTNISAYLGIINSAMSSTPNIFQMVTGFLHATDFLHRPNEYSQTTNFEIEPLDHEKKTFPATSNKIWKNKISNTSSIAIKTHPTQNNNFIVAELNCIAHNVGEPAILYDGNRKPILCIIRHNQTTSLANTWRILLEKVPGEISSVDIFNKSRLQYSGILINTPDNQLEIVLAAEKLSTGSTITIQQKEHPRKKVRLEKLLDFTPYSMRFLLAEVI